MGKRKHKSFIEKVFSGITKFVMGVVICIIGSFILLSGNISMNISFNKAETKPVTMIEKVGQAIHLVKKGYDAVQPIIK